MSWYFSFSIQIKTVNVLGCNILEYCRYLESDQLGFFLARAYTLTICFPVHNGLGFHIAGGKVINRGYESNSGRRAP